MGVRACVRVCVCVHISYIEIVCETTSWCVQRLQLYITNIYMYIYIYIYIYQCCNCCYIASSRSLCFRANFTPQLPYTIPPDFEYGTYYGTYPNLMYSQVAAPHAHPFSLPSATALRPGLGECRVDTQVCCRHIMHSDCVSK